MKMNLPNKLTLTRFIMALIIVIVMVLPYQEWGWTPYVIPTTGFNVVDFICCLLFIIASVTDTLDGNIARKRHLITDFGKFMDPLADKFLVNSALIVLAVEKSLYLPVIIVVLMIGRDLAVDGLRFIAASKGEVLAANKWGKIKTTAQMIVIPFIFLNGFPMNYLLKGYTYIFTIVLACIALFFSLLSGFIYLYQGRKYFVSQETSDKKDI